MICTFSPSNYSCELKNNATDNSSGITGSIENENSILNL